MSVKIDITGHLGQDPELKHGNDGTPRCRLRVAAVPRKRDPQTQQWEDDGESQWYSVTVFGAAAESTAAALAKGTRVRVSGTLVHRSWQGQDGTTRTDHEIKHADVTVYPPKSSQNQGQGAPVGGQWGASVSGGFEAAQGSFNDAPPF